MKPRATDKMLATLQRPADGRRCHASIPGYGAHRHAAPVHPPPVSVSIDLSVPPAHSALASANSLNGGILRIRPVRRAVPVSPFLSGSRLGVILSLHCVPRIAVFYPNRRRAPKIAAAVSI